MSLGHGASIVRNGLVLHLDAANKKSYPGTGTVWNDLSGNGSNATLYNNPTYSPDNNGNIIFDPTNDYSEIPTCPIKSGDFTVEIFFKPNDVTNNRNIIYAPTETFGTLRIYRNAPSTVVGTYRWLFYYETTTLTVGATGSYMSGYNAGEWAHSAMVLNSTGTMRSYMNGNYQFTNTPTGFSRWLYPNSYINVGYVAADAAIGSFKMYNRALSAQEIQQNFDALRGRYGI